MNPSNAAPRALSAGFRSPVNLICLAVILISALCLVCPIGGIITILSYDFYVIVGPPIIGSCILLTAIVTLVLPGQRRRWFARSIQAGILAHGCVGALIVAIGISGGGFAAVHRIGFLLRMKRTADIAAIRAWAASYQPGSGDAELTYHDDMVNVDRKNWPRCIAVLHPRGVTYFTDTKSVCLNYGGGMHSWSFHVSQDGEDVFEME